MAGHKNPPDFDPDSNAWVMYEHMAGMFVAVRKHPVKSLIVFCGICSVPFVAFGVGMGLFRGTEYASRGGFDPVAMGSTFGAKVARPIAFGTGDMLETVYVGWSGEQPVATPVNYQRRTRSQQNWAVVPTNYEERN